MFKGKKENTTVEILIAQAFSSYDDRLKLKDRQISALTKEVEELKTDIKTMWEVMQKMDAKLSTAYAAALGGDSSEAVTMSEYKFGEGIDDVDKP